MAEPTEDSGSGAPGVPNGVKAAMAVFGCCTCIGLLLILTGVGALVGVPVIAAGVLALVLFVLAGARSRPAS